jgi:hypothetical protein
MLVIMSPYAMNLFMADIKADILTAPGLTVKLFQNNYVPTPSDTTAAYTEATFDGYVVKTITLMFGPTRNPDGSFAIRAFLNWTMSGSTTPNTVWGAFILDRLGNLILASRFPASVQMIDAFSDLSAEVEIALTTNGLIGGVNPIT